jgi:hypothetical protein
MKKLLILGAMVIGLAAVGAAQGAPDNGATVTNDAYCIPSPFATWCWDIHTVTKMTTTSSGNVSYVTNGTVDYGISFAFSDCTYSKTTPVHEHWLTKNGELQSQSERLIDTTTFTCASGYSYSCTSRFDLHLANGAVQFQRPEFVCSND